MQSDLQRLRDENEELREEVRQLRALLLPEQRLPRAWNLPRREEQIFRALLTNEVCHKDRLFAIVYGNDSDVCEAVIESHMSKMRSRLRPFGVVISSKRFEGYRLEGRNEWKERLMGWWEDASDRQRAAQVRGGVSLGMTPQQIAVASATEPENVEGFLLAQKERRAAPPPAPAPIAKRKPEPPPVFDRAPAGPSDDDFRLDDALLDWSAS